MVSVINQNRSRRVFGIAQIAQQHLGDTGRCSKLPFPTAACHTAARNAKSEKSADDFAATRTRWSNLETNRLRMEDTSQQLRVSLRAAGVSSCRDKALAGTIN